MLRPKKKIGRNDLCPCGSGKKFKRCHGAPSNALPLRRDPKEYEETVRLHLQRAKAADKQREQQQGLGRAIISMELNGTRFVAVGNRMMWSNKWKTVPDFLGDYIRSTLTPEWGNAELAKPFEQRHPILVWYDYVCRLQKETIKAPGEVTAAPLTGAAEAWFQLAYDLYSLEHNVELQQKLLRRLKDPEMFLGARYETFVAGAMIRAGFDIKFEDEDDRRSTHVEFTATCKKSGRKYSVEAKQRNVTGDNERFRLGKLLQKALRKTANHPRIVFIGIGYLDAQDAGDGVMPARFSKALGDLRGFEGRHLNGQPMPPAYLFVTNRPHDLDLEGKHIRTTILAEGFRIPGFKLDAAFPSLREAHHARKEHEDMHQLLESMRVHSEIPTTFDGTPPELAFTGKAQRLIIGETYLVPDSKGVDRPGKLTSATVNEAESKAYVAHHLDTGESVIGTVPLSSEELAAYRRHPDTFFGVEMKAPRKTETPLELFDFIMDGYRDTPRERLLEFMADHPDIDELKMMSKEDLTEIYAERCAWSIMRQSEKNSSK
ncbi:MAG: YecA family protein [Curvibacter sp.]